MNFLNKLLGRDDDRAVVRPLYAAIVAEARQPFWYERGGVADSIDGRFEMVSAVLALVLIRMEALGVAAREPSTLLTETFVEDMDGQLRQLGIGDIVVGKHIGRMMGALGGKLGAYRAALSGDAPLADALIRNLYRGETPDAGTLQAAEAGLLALNAGLEKASLADLLDGRLIPA